jgi:hypothetical protein
LSIRMFIRRDYMKDLQCINIINYVNGSERLQNWTGESWPLSCQNSSKWSLKYAPQFVLPHFIDGQEFTGILTQPVSTTSYISGTPMSAYPNATTPGMYRQMIVRIEYSVHHPTAGVRFVGCEPGDNVHL